MPATDDYLRSPKLMHKVFCASSLLLLFTTVWMMWADYNDEWRTYQRRAFTLQAERLKTRENQIKAAPEHKAKVEELKGRIDSAKKSLAAVQATEKSLTEKVRLASDTASNHLRSLKNERAKRDVARADYNLAIRDNLKGAALEKRTADYKTIADAVDVMEAQYAEFKLAVDSAKFELAKVTGERDAALKELKGEETQSVLIHAALNKIEPDNWLSKAKRQLMLLPIIDGFNSPERITQDWLPRLQIPLGGMGVVSRFDRCRTCHAMID